VRRVAFDLAHALREIVLDPYRLLGSDHDFHISCVAAASSGLHAKLLEAVQRSMERLLTLDIVPPPQPDQEGC
jgi:hypothetical protein